MADLGLRSAGVGLAKEGESEDACFLQGSWMGVADGVGGWRELGLSSREFSGQLMANCRELVASQGEALHPKEVMARAVAGTKCLGSSTVLLGCIRRNFLLAANLGDSGFMLLRAWQVIEASKRTPFQVGFVPDSDEAQFDDPGLAETHEVPVQEGDVVVMATDGLFDYLYPCQIIKVLRKCFENGGTVKDAADVLVKKARLRMQNVTPYFDACTEQGKRLDDVTVLIGQVMCTAESIVDGTVELTQEEVWTYGEDLKLEALAITPPPEPGHSHDGFRVKGSCMGLEADTCDCTDFFRLEALAATHPLEPGHSHDAFFVKGSCMGLAAEICNYTDIRLGGAFCGHFSKELVRKCAKLVVGKFKNPKDIIRAAAASKSRCRIRLTSTIILASLATEMDDRGTMKPRLCVANMGDSRVMVIRDWKTVAITPSMCHGSEHNPLDNPFKLGNSSAGSGMGDAGDDSSSIVEHQLDVCEGDLVVCGNAGVFNNLHKATIVKCLKQHPNDLEQAAWKLVSLAKQLMLEPAPWVVALSQNTGIKCTHISDATVILARVVRAQPFPQPERCT